jgi:hypothetical protein
MCAAGGVTSSSAGQETFAAGCALSGADERFRSHKHRLYVMEFASRCGHLHIAAALIKSWQFVAQSSMLEHQNAGAHAEIRNIVRPQSKLEPAEFAFIDPRSSQSW